MKISRRRFLQLGLATGAASLLAGRIDVIQKAAGLPPGVVHAQAVAQVPLAGSAIPQFVDPLPALELDLRTSINLEMREFKTNVLSTGALPGYNGTTVWGYLNPGQTARDSYIGPVIVATRGVPTEVTYVNLLGDTAGSNLLAYKNSVDQTLHWADPLSGENMCAHMIVEMMPPMGDCVLPYSGTIPAAVHLHGGEIPDLLDGGPDSWFTSDGAHIGHGFYSRGFDGVTPQNYATYRYPNTQEGALLWFHDHTLGATRLNVYAGLAGAYLLTDPGSTYTNPFNFNMPVVPLVIQDRMFDTNGELFFPAGLPYISNPEHPLWVPEFVGDTIVVNGKTWPYFEVEPKRYLFLLINGSNARTYEMFLTNPVTKVNGPALWQAATDGGLLDTPVKIDPNAPKGQLQRLVMMPGERTWVIIDFTGMLPGTRLVLKNVAKTPYPGGEVPNGNTIGRIMQFRVVPLTAADASTPPAQLGSLWPAGQQRVKLVNANGTLAAGVSIDKKRQLTLNEVMGMPTVVDGVAYPGGPLEVLVNNTKWEVGATEDPVEGQTELWEIINLTADAHPIHTHLVQFQLQSRQNFDVGKYNAAYDLAFGGIYKPAFGPPLTYNTLNADGAVGGNPAVTPFLKGSSKPPEANEVGWKDTVLVLPGMVTRFVVRFTPTDVAAGAQGAFPFNPSLGDGYVWHCHIVDHEDNEMMRQLVVTPKSVNRILNKNTDF